MLKWSRPWPPKNKTTPRKEGRKEEKKEERKRGREGRKKGGREREKKGGKKEISEKHCGNKKVVFYTSYSVPRMNSIKWEDCPKKEGIWSTLFDWHFDSMTGFHSDGYGLPCLTLTLTSVPKTSIYQNFTAQHVTGKHISNLHWKLPIPTCSTVLEGPLKLYLFMYLFRCVCFACKHASEN